MYILFFYSEVYLGEGGVKGALPPPHPKNFLGKMRGGDSVTRGKNYFQKNRTYIQMLGYF